MEIRSQHGTRAAVVGLVLACSVVQTVARDAGTPDGGAQPAVLADQECREREACKKLGQCGARDGAYVSVDRDDCRRAEVCKYEGQCTLRDSKCVVGSSNDCSNDGPCSSDGRCVLAKGKCIAASSRNCRGTVGCRYNGRCTAKDGKCIAASSREYRKPLSSLHSRYRDDSRRRRKSASANAIKRPAWFREPGPKLHEGRP